MQLCKSGRSLGKKTSLCIMFFMTTSFFVAEIVVGHITHSTALVADSFHMLSDVISLIIGFLAVFYSEKRSRSNTYGWARVEVLGALTNAVFLLALCFTIVVSAVQRLVEIERIKNPLLVLYVGSAGLVINLIGLCMFHDHSHGLHDHHNHDHHNHDHHCHVRSNEKSLVERKDATLEKNQIKTNTHSHGGQLNMKGVFLHVLGDALGSVIVIISALTIKFAEGEWRFYIDPLMSLVLACIIIFTTWPLLKRSSLILLQSPPDYIDKNDLICELVKIQGIQAIHELHVWQLSGNIVIASAHVTMHNEDSFNETAMEVNKLFHRKGVHSITLQPEFYECSEGKSLCGASNCHYLSENLHAVTSEESETNSDEETSNSLECNNNHGSACLLPCVSKECEEFRCCSSNRDKDCVKRKVKKGEPNPCYVDMDIHIEKSASEYLNGDLSSSSPNRRSSLPHCDSREQQTNV